MLEESYIYSEIHEQPQSLARLLEGERENVRALAATIRDHEIHYVLIAARGTSDNAGRYANYLFGSFNGLPVALATPSLYTIYHRPPKLRNALVIGISQSGKSPDIVSVLEDARQQGELTLAITNDAYSDLAGQADHIVQLHAGEETSIAATKTYTAELLVVAMLAAHLAQEKERIAEIEEIPEQVSKILEINKSVAAQAARYRYMRDCVVIGRGYNYATAFELALKLKELTYTIAEPYSSADFLHGPLALIEDGFPAIVIAPSGAMLPELRSFIKTLNDRDAETIVISDDSRVLEMGRIKFPLLASAPEWLSPITAIIPGQLLAMHLAHAKDYAPDHPRGLRKVTETR